MASRCCTHGKAKRLLVAGADPSVTKADLVRRLGGERAAGPCCVDLGSESVDTRSNAEEAARWLARHGYQSVRLITSDWHMRRARYEFREVLGDKCRGHPRRGPHRSRGFMTLFGEYNKYVLRRLAVLARHLMQALRSLLFALHLLSRDRAVRARRLRRAACSAPAPMRCGGPRLVALPSLAVPRTCSASAAQVDGAIPPAPHLIAVKHQSMFETIEMVRLAGDAGGRPEARARRPAVVRLGDPALWRHPGRPRGGRQGASRDARRGRRPPSPAAGR